MIHVADLIRAGRHTLRCHTLPVIRHTNVAEHSWGVALLAYQIYIEETGEPPPMSLLLAALTHDLGESVTGDTPYTAKVAYPLLSTLLKAIETIFEDENDIPSYEETLNREARDILKAADMLDFYLLAKEEVGRGNTLMMPYLRTAEDVLSGTIFNSVKRIMQDAR